MRPAGTMWNDDALAALDSAGLTRRGFLKTSGALIVGFSALGRTTARFTGRESMGRATTIWMPGLRSAPTVA